MTEIEKRSGEAVQAPQVPVSKVRVPYEGGTEDAEELSFEASGPPLTLKLADGTRIEIAHEVTKVYRLCDKKKEDDSPIYILTGEVKVRTLTRKPETGE